MYNIYACSVNICSTTTIIRPVLSSTKRKGFSTAPLNAKNSCSKVKLVYSLLSNFKSWCRTLTKLLIINVER